MNRSIIFRPLASAAVLALVGLCQPAFAALSHAGSLSRVAPPALPAQLNGTLITLHPAQRGGDIAVTNGNFYSVRFTSLAQEQRLRVGSRLAVSGDARDQVHLLVHGLRTQGISTRAHLRGVVARRLGRGAVELLGMNGAAMVISLGHARITRVYHRAGSFGPALASADDGPTIAPGNEIDTAVTLSGAGAVATGTATVAAPSQVQVEVEGFITAMDRAAGTITVQDDDGGPATVVALGAAGGTYYVGQDVEVFGTVTSAGSNGATVQAQFIRLKGPDGYAAGPGATIKVEGHIIAVNAAAGTITVQDDDRPPTVVALGAVKGTFYVWQKVEVYGVLTSPGSYGATVQAQLIRFEDPDGYAAAPGATIKVDGHITAVDRAASTIAVQDDDGPPTVVALGAVRGTFYVWQKVEVYGTVTSAGSNGATVQAQFIQLKDPDGYVAAPGAPIKVEGRIIAVNAAAGTITVQDDDGPATVVALGAARGTFYPWQKVEVYGTVTGSGSNGVTVQAQFIKLND